jgi:hypothetical protein
MFINKNYLYLHHATKHKFKIKKVMKNLIGKKVIVRADRAGVFYGTLTAKEGSEVTLENARKLYYWTGANAIEEIALSGVKKASNCKFTVVNKEITINNWIQINPCTDSAIDNIESVVEWKN